MGFLTLLSGYLVGVLYSYGFLRFTEPSDNLVNKVHSLFFKRFEAHPQYVSQASALGDDGSNGGLPMFVRQPQQQPMPPPGQPRGDAGRSNATSQSVQPFQGKGVSVGTAVSGYQGNSTGSYASQQNIREEPKGPNPNVQKSKLIPERKENEQMDEDDDDHEIEGNFSNDSKGDEKDLI